MTLEGDTRLIYPKKQIALNKRDVSITCFSEQKPQWLKDGLPLRDACSDLKRVCTKANSLHISSVTYFDIGIYSCSGYNNKTYFKDFSELLVAGRMLKPLTYKTFKYLITLETLYYISLW